MKINKSALLKAGAAIIILGGGIAAMQLLASTKAEANKREVEPPIRKVETMSPVFGDMAYEVSGNGLVESSGSIPVISTVTGKVLYVKEDLSSGTFVQEDELLVKVDSRQAENTLNLARSELIKAVAALIPQFKSSNPDWYEKWNNYLASIPFGQEPTPSLPLVSNSREKLLISTYGIYNAFYSVKNAEIQLEQHFIYSPIAGYVSGEEILEESFLATGQALFTIIDGENLTVSVPLTVGELNRLNVEESPLVEIHSPNNRDFLIGKVVSRDAQLERSSQMVNVHIRFSNPKLLADFAPGNYVDLVIEGKVMENTAEIPRHAVQENQFVYTFEEGALGREEVLVKAASGDSLFIGNTLPAGTEIVTTILQKPLIGMKLSSVNERVVLNNEKDS